jgi:AcrR family transcriptional regulator
MPYTAEHKAHTRARIVESARELFNHRGFSEVSIDEIMAAAGLTRGGFYNHFQAKEDLYIEAINTFKANHAGHQLGELVDQRANGGDSLGSQIIQKYLSLEHLTDPGNHCPMISLSSDIYRAGPKVKRAYRELMMLLASVFEAEIRAGEGNNPTAQALSLAALCVGGMVLARTIDDPALSQTIIESTRATALDTLDRSRKPS